MKTRDLIKIITFYARFTPTYTKIGYYARRLTWGRNPPMGCKGQNWLITGASLGLGKAMMKEAAEAGANVIAVARSQERLEAARSELSPEAAGRVRFMTADMSLQSGTQELLNGLLESGEKFDVLMNNVGVLFNEMILTEEGREATFVINVLSHFLLTEGLLKNGAFRDNAAIVNMTSGGMYNAPLGHRGLNTTDASRYNGKASYAYAKRAQVALTEYWDGKYPDTGLRSYVTHPGWAKTPGVKKALPVFWKIQNLILRTPLQGADTALWLCATRPATPSKDNVWFDRKARPVHMFEFTKKPQCTIEELVEYLQQELDQQTASSG
jgi:dehydrogenase/reductase SDR family protein 12